MNVRRVNDKDWVLRSVGYGGKIQNTTNIYNFRELPRPYQQRAEGFTEKNPWTYNDQFHEVPPTRRKYPSLEP